MRAQEYAEAIFEASKNKTDEEVDLLVSNLRLLLEKKGHLSLLPIIVREFEKIEKKRGSVSELVLRVANKSDAEKYVKVIEKDIERLNAGNLKKRIVVDPALVGGYELKANGLMLDKSYKHSLLNMYTKLITSNNL